MPSAWDRLLNRLGAIEDRIGEMEASLAGYIEAAGYEEDEDEGEDEGEESESESESPSDEE